MIEAETDLGPSIARNLTHRIDARLRSHPQLTGGIERIMARIGRRTKADVAPRKNMSVEEKMPGTSPCW
jgi:hypothetical protein